jgi:hypothetical protein
MESADLLLHPVRLRIVQALLGDRALTTGALAEELADVSPATPQHVDPSVIEDIAGWLTTYS